MRTDTLYTLLL